MLVCIAASIVPLCFKETNSLFIWLDRATVTVFIVDYLLRWWKADLKYEKSGKWAFLRYPFSFFGIVDLLSILPSLTMLSSGFKLFGFSASTKRSRRSNSCATRTALNLF